MHIELSNYYKESYALIAGIDEYRNAPPLQYAVSDAQEVAALLVDKFGFVSDNVELLLNEDATASSILARYLAFASRDIPSNSRLVVFFAGHGHTLPSRGGDVGFLVPADGVLSDLSTLIRWDQITRAGDLIPSKHILYLMDACYGGLAITRALKPGASRFLRDMLTRYSRQVITAGKADEVVADLGGPLPNHSVFTGYLLKALSGEAADSEGIMTANGVMAYVYRHVGQDPDSKQTPHFGYLDGDGDLVFDAPILADFQETEKEGQDALISIPVPAVFGGGSQDMSLEKQTKEFLSDPKYQIHMHELLVEKTRETIALTDDDAFPVQAPWSPKEFQERLERYERLIEELLSIHVLIGYWGRREFHQLSTLAARRLAERIQPSTGNRVWLAARWYPVFILAYGFGIAAMAASRLDNLHHFLHVSILNPRSQTQEPLLLSLIAGVGDLSQSFKSLPDRERQYTPHSEYMYRLLQPKLDDLLFLGGEYEGFFDRFEVLICLEHAHLNKKNGRNYWGPIGRFGWKHQRGRGSPFAELITEAEMSGENWPPIRSGFFDGSVEQFTGVAAAMLDRLNKLGWV